MMAEDVERTPTSLTAPQAQHLKVRDSLVTRGLRNISEHLANDIIVQAMELLKQRRLDECISLCSSRLADTPNDDILWQIQGVCLGEQGKNIEAIGSIERSLDLNRVNPYCWSIKSSLLVKVDRYVEAIACDDQAINLDPESSFFKEKKHNHLAELRKKKVCRLTFRPSTSDRQKSLSRWAHGGLSEKSPFQERCMSCSIAISKTLGIVTYTSRRKSLFTDALRRRRNCLTYAMLFFFRFRQF
jgi:tetratricopeptide (TPR) repeat protein